MKIHFAPFTEELAPAVADFNRRLSSAGVSPFPESPISAWLPKTADRSTYEEYFLALEGGSVRGGYILRHMEVCFGDEQTSVAGFRLPISEGVVNGAYRLVGHQVVRDALLRQPLAFGTGMGGPDQPVSRLLKAMGWNVQPVPFYFKVKNGFRFLRNVTSLRRTRLGRLAADLVAFSGAAWVGGKLVDGIATRRPRAARALSVRTVDRFSSWADELWNACKSRYSLIAVRDSAALNLLYRPEHRKFIRLQVSEKGRLLGWAVAMDSQLTNHERFGSLRAGLIMDCLALPEDAPEVIRAASSILEQRGVDFIRSHQSHPCWRAALKEAGFLEGPSYFLFAASPAFAEKLDRIDPGRTGMHLNRGDGDGPLYL